MKKNIILLLTTLTTLNPLMSVHASNIEAQTSAQIEQQLVTPELGEGERSEESETPITNETNEHTTIAATEEIAAEETTTTEEPKDENGATELETLAVENVINDGAYTFYLNADKTIRYASYKDGNNQVISYIQYYAGTKYEDVETHKSTVMQYEAYVSENNLLTHTREYDVNGNWIKAFEYPSGTRINHDKRYWEGRQYTHDMKRNTRNGELDHTTQFNLENGKVSIYSQYYAGTRFGDNHGAKVKYQAYINEKDETVNHVREYDTNQYWVKAFEFPGSVKIDHSKAYWEGRQYTHEMQPKTTKGELHHTTHFNLKSGKASSYAQYYKDTKYDKYHQNHVQFKAYINEWDDTINHVRGYDKDGNWEKVFEFPSGTKIDHNKEYWEGRLYTFYLKNNEGELNYSIRWNEPGGHTQVGDTFYEQGAKYGEGHANKIKGKWLWPVNSWTISTNYLRDPAPCNSSSGGPNCYPHSINGGRHYGIDIAASTGTEVWAANKGEIISSGSDSSRGNYIIIKHDDDIYSNYYHLNGFVRTGGWVASGELIGYVGSTGAAYGPHLHFQIGRGGYGNGNSINPAEYIPGMKWNYSMNIMDMIIEQEEKKRREASYMMTDFIV